ncbi:hypothetical protein L2E82_12773 [Cichorium intybus]|uniref:Uncharacterized protein n=1 Tax=Cichorium intybus TaxID=13427 RepID=A0ACB9GH03_CICIN|nr:hypothetical protein L2E82_12773 [Cichorium intybus]
MIICYRSVLRHPFLVCMLCLLIWMQRLFPLFFSFLVSSSPVIVSTAVLLGTLLSFGQPNIPEIEKEPKSEQYEIQKLESKVTSQTEVVGRDGNFASEETNGSKIEVGDKSFEVINPINDDNSHVEVDKPLYLVDDGEFVTEENCENFVEEHLVEESKNETDEVKVVLGSHYSPLQQSEDEHIVLESDDKLWEGSADPLNSDPALLWKRVEGDGYDDDEDDESDSGSDLAESSSPDASMADIIPMLDELHPLLSEEQEIRQEPDHEDDIKNHQDSEHSLESGDSSSSSESNDEDGVQNHEDLEAGDEEDGEDEEDEEEEDKESKHRDKEDEPRSAITWTEDDQKNLMNLGTSEMERNRRLENLIARRRARKTMRMQAEKNLIDLEGADLPWNIPPISTARNNPFDYDANDNIPGSAPSVLLKRRNPFDLPYDSSEEKPDLVGDTFQQEFAGFQPKESLFRRHESFNVGPSNFGAFRSERQETKLRPYFVPERTFQRQFSGISDSKASSVPDTESVSSADDLENKDHIEDEQSLDPEMVSEKDQEQEELISESHERPYFVPEHVDSVGTSFLSYERQISEVSESKLSSVPDTESVSSADDLENKDHIDLSQEPQLISFEDDENMESVQVVESDERLDEAEITVGNVTNEQEAVNATSSMEIMADAVHSSASSLSSLDEVSEQIYNEKEDDDDDEVATSVSETSDYFVEHGNSIERSETDVTSLLVEVSHPKEPVYDSSPRSVARNLSSSSICNDLQAIPESNGSFSGQDSQETVPKIEFVDSSEADEVGSRSIPNHDANTLTVQDDVHESELNVGPTVVDDHLHKDESFQHQSLNCADVVLDMDEEVEVPSSISHESSHQEEDISQPEEEPSLVDDPEELQVQQGKQDEVTSPTSETQFTEVVHEETFENPHHFVSEEEFPILDISANEPSEENLELSQVQISSNNLENLQIQEAGNKSVLNVEPDVVEDFGIEHNNVGDKIEGVDEIDEDLLVELDAVGDFSVNDLVSTSNEKEDDQHAYDHVLETKLSADEDSYSQDQGSVLNEMEQPPHALDLETKHSGDEDSDSKDLGSTLDEMKQDPQDLETKLSGDEDSVESSLNEMTQDPQASGHVLETFYSVDEYAFDSTLNEMKHEPQASHHVLETNEDLSKTEKMDEQVMDKESGKTEVEGASEDETFRKKLTNEVELPQETRSNSTHGTENGNNTDKE